ncbi:MAG: hypothetical protein ACRDHY_17130 [Anaerolineales bacterium]
MTASIRIDWPAVENEQGRPMLWFGSWLVGVAGDEAEWFHSARGGAQGNYPVPPHATGVRIRRWPSHGLDAEYADLLDLASLNHIVATDLDFDTRQEFSLLPADHS